MPRACEKIAHKRPGMSTGKRTKLKRGDVVAQRYRIEGVVGKGGFGAVYKATQLSSGQLVALKVLLANYSTSATDSKRFQREAALVQKLQHPNVVRMFDFGETERGVPFIAFELLHGRALREVLKEGPLSLYRTAEITRDMLGALEAAHALGVVHRDIKPQNIFLCDDRSLGAKVLDFGIAKALQGEESKGTQLTEAGQMIGTPHYMSPEQVRGTTIGPTTDLYALGLLMAEMVSGERVVKGEALIEVYMTHISDRPIDLPRAAAESVLAPIILKASAKVIPERYQTATEMRVALEQALGLAAGGEHDISTRMMPERGYGHDPLEATADMNELPTAPMSTSATVVMDVAELEAQTDAIDHAIQLRQGAAASRIIDDLAATAFLDDGAQPWLEATADADQWQPMSAQSQGPGQPSMGQQVQRQPTTDRPPPGQQHPLALSNLNHVSGSHAIPPQLSTQERFVPYVRERRERPKTVGPLIAIVVAVILLGAAVAGLLIWQPWSAA